MCVCVCTRVCVCVKNEKHIARGLHVWLTWCKVHLICMSPDASACLQVCFYDPAGTESKAVAVIKIGVKLDIPFEIFCRSDRTAGQDGFGVGTSITAFAEVRSDIIPYASYRADFQWLPMGSDEACQASSIPYYSPKGNNQWFGQNAEWQWRDAYNFECAGMCGCLCSCSINFFATFLFVCTHVLVLVFGCMWFANASTFNCSIDPSDQI